MQASTALTQADSTAVRLAAFLRRLLIPGSHDFLQRLDDLELSLSQVKALHLLGEDEGDRTLKDLGDQLGLSLPAVSRAVDGLVKRGLVDRAEDADDRRFKRVRATERGRKITRELMEVRLAGLADFVESLDDRQRKALDKALALIVAEDER